MPIKTDNSCALGVVTKNVQPKCLKAMDIQFHWLRDRHKQQQFYCHWKRAIHNKGDYQSKAQPIKVHKEQRPSFVLNNIMKDKSRNITIYAPSARVCFLPTPLLKGGLTQTVINRLTTLNSQYSYKLIT